MFWICWSCFVIFVYIGTYLLLKFIFYFISYKHSPNDTWITLSWVIWTLKSLSISGYNSVLRCYTQHGWSILYKLINCIINIGNCCRIPLCMDESLAMDEYKTEFICLCQPFKIKIKYKVNQESIGETTRNSSLSSDKSRTRTLLLN